jgi:hypothetical protein
MKKPFLTIAVAALLCLPAMAATVTIGGTNYAVVPDPPLPPGAVPVATLAPAPAPAPVAVPASALVVTNIGGTNYYLPATPSASDPLLLDVETALGVLGTALLAYLKVWVLARLARKGLPDKVQTGAFGEILGHLALEINPKPGLVPAAMSTPAQQSTVSPSTPVKTQ